MRIDVYKRQGYSHVNLSGVGCPELGSLLLMPTTGELSVDYKEYGSRDVYKRQKCWVMKIWSASGK